MADHAGKRRTGSRNAHVEAHDQHASAGSQSDSAALQDLQRRAGNAAVGSVIRRMSTGPVTVGAANDPAEREADQVARSLTGGASRRATGTEVDEPVVGEQGGAIPHDLQRQVLTATGGGSPLPDTIQRTMESRFGNDLSHVRVHADERSASLNDQLSARAFTLGSDVFMRPEDQPGRPGAEGVLAHELTHVVQDHGTTARRTIHRLYLKAYGGGDPKKDWTTTGSKKRSKQLKAIDALVRAYNGGGYMGGAPMANVAKLQAIRTAIQAWQTSKGKNLDKTSRQFYVQALDAEVGWEIAAETARQQAKDDEDLRAAGRKVAYERIHPDLAGLAKREAPKGRDFSDATAAKPGRTQALIGARTGGGALTATAMDTMRDGDLEEARDVERASAADAALIREPGVSDDDIRGYLASKVNAMTNKPIFPELANLLDPAAPDLSTAAEVATTRTVHGVAVTFHSNPGAVQIAEREAQVAAAVKKVTDAGVTMPAFKAYLPALSRSLKVFKTATDCEVSQFGKAGNRAVFKAPDQMHISPGNINNPLDERQGNGEYAYSSTRLAPEGVGTMVHEFGHMLHFHHAPERFWDLFNASWTPLTVGGQPVSGYVEEQVSRYGSNNPKEFVAEVFLNLTYGKDDYPEPLIDLYVAFGGVPVPSVDARTSSSVAAARGRLGV